MNAPSTESASAGERELRARGLEAARLLATALAREDVACGGALLARHSEAAIYEAIVASVLRQAVLCFAQARQLETIELSSARLFAWDRFRLPGEASQVDLRASPVWAILSRGSENEALTTVPYAELPIETVGGLYEFLLGHTLVREREELHLVAGQARRRSGSFFTPVRLTEQVVLASVERLRERAAAAKSQGAWQHLRICDPALGGGAFLLESCRRLAAELARDEAELRAALRAVATRCLAGVDLSPLAVATAEVSLWLLVGDETLPAREVGARLRVGDALDGFEWSQEFADVFQEQAGFDLIIGNPPWVAYAGRASQPLAPEKRQHYRRAFSVFRGYPTLHGLFVEQATRLAPNGVIALVIPSPVADLDGYRAVRRVVSARHRVCEPLLEFGQDAFEGVTQPCFALIAEAVPASEASERPWLLSERQRALSSATAIRAPGCFELLERMEKLPKESFGEMGFQSTRGVTERLFLRSGEPQGPFRYPLLEGRDVREFRQGAVRLFLNDDPDELRRAACKARPAKDYERVAFVVRQTAKVTIAALHAGLPFRNSLLAGFAHPDYSPELMVALLNSALYRALHLSRQRDARQAAFPQVKIAHLRALPAPPRGLPSYALLENVTRRFRDEGVSLEGRRELDRIVFELFGLDRADREAVLSFLRELAPELGHG